jgi:hypothetical protein
LELIRKCNPINLWAIDTAELEVVLVGPIFSHIVSALDHQSFFVQALFSHWSFMLLRLNGSNRHALCSLILKVLCCVYNQTDTTVLLLLISSKFTKTYKKFTAKIAKIFPKSAFCLWRKCDAHCLNARLQVLFYLSQKDRLL